MSATSGPMGDEPDFGAAEPATSTTTAAPAAPAAVSAPEAAPAEKK